MLINIEGLIGVGKTTLTNELDGAKFFEPVESSTFLELYYLNPHRWAFSMQVNMLFERFKMLQVAQYQSIDKDVILDRSFYGDYAFALVQRKEGLFTDKEFETYKKMFKYLLPQLTLPDLIIWLDCPLEIIFERIKKRGRGCENTISFEYMKDLYNAYQIVLAELNKYCTIVNVDATKDALSVYSQTLAAIDKKRKELAANKNDCFGTLIGAVKL